MNKNAYTKKRFCVLTRSGLNPENMSTSIKYVSINDWSLKLLCHAATKKENAQKITFSYNFMDNKTRCFKSKEKCNSSFPKKVYKAKRNILLYLLPWGKLTLLKREIDIAMAIQPFVQDLCLFSQEIFITKFL